MTSSSDDDGGKVPEQEEETGSKSRPVSGDDPCGVPIY